MKALLRIVPVLALCAGLSGCGNDGDTSSTTTESTTTTDAPIGQPANTGAGMQGSTGVDSAAMRNNTSGSNTSGSTDNQTRGRNTPEENRNTHLTPKESISNRSGLAPAK